MFQIKSTIRALVLLNLLTLKAPITTAADDKFCDIFPADNSREISYLICFLLLLLLFLLLFFFLKKAEEFEIVVCYKL